MSTPAGTEAADPGASGVTSDAQTLLAPTVSVTALLAEAAGKSDIMWVDVPGERSFPVWYAWVTDRFYVVSGEGEQLLPRLPEVVRLILRSKDSGGRLLTVNATAHLLAPHTPSWETAVAARWAESGAVHALHPFGPPVEAPGAHPDDAGRSPLAPAPATTVGWRPWHLGRS